MTGKLARDSQRARDGGWRLGAVAGSSGAMTGKHDEIQI
jgi:hypothetical protein